MIDPLPRVEYFEDTILTGEWRPFHDVVPRGKPPITFDDVGVSRDGRSLRSYLELIGSTCEDLTSWLDMVRTR